MPNTSSKATVSSKKPNSSMARQKGTADEITRSCIPGNSDTLNILAESNVKMVNSEKIPIKIVDHGVQSVDDSSNAISNENNPIFTSNPEPIQETETSMKPKADNESKAVDNWMGSNGGAAPVKDMDTVVNPTQCNINGEKS